MKKGLFFLSAPLALILFLNFSIQFTEHVDPLANNPENKSNSMGFILPIEMHSVTKYTPFGMRMDPKFKNRKMHVGIDLTAAEGTQIFAAESGQVLSTEYNENGYGNKIVIRHNDSVSTTYAHLASIAVEKGQKVYQGDVIGACGNTGKSSGPHLHFEVLLNDSFIDPEPLIQLGDLSATLGSSLVNKSELVVIIDPGHGGEDKGVSNDFLSEKDLTLSYAITLAEELKNQNIRAVLTRQSDEMVSLKDRVNLTSEYAEALFISLHVNNAENKDAKGVEIYIPGEEELNHDKSKQFGVALGKVIQENNIENRGINTAGFYVLKSSACPSVIIEVGFMSSEMERINSEEYRASLCKVIASSIDFYAE